MQKLNPSKDFIVKKCKCLACEHALDGAFNAVSARKPKSGDLTICMYCGHIMAFKNKDLELRELTDEEIIEVAGNPHVVEVQKARKEVMDKRKP